MAVEIMMNCIVDGRGLCKQKKYIVNTACKEQGKAIMDVSLLKELF